jgi:hypothetical protein
MIQDSIKDVCKVMSHIGATLPKFFYGEFVIKFENGRVVGFKNHKSEDFNKTLRNIETAK